MTKQLIKGDGVSVAAFGAQDIRTGTDGKCVTIAVAVGDSFYYSCLDRDQYMDWARQNYEAAKEAWGAGFARED